MLVAQDGQDAIQKSADQKGRIDLLVSNVQMPGMTGVDLARAMRQSRPDLRVILTASFEQGLLVLDTGWQFIQKPYLIKVLLDKIVELIKKPQAPQVDRST